MKLRAALSISEGTFSVSVVAHNFGFLMTSDLDNARRVRDTQHRRTDGASCPRASSRCCEHTCLARLEKGLGCNAKVRRHVLPLKK